MIETKNLWHVYQPEEVVALRNVNLKIDDGDFLAIVGHNGSGKTTLVKHFVSLLKPTKGQVLIDGRDVREFKVSQLAGMIGYVFQNPDHQIFAESVREEISFGPRNLGFSNRKVKKIVDEVAKKLGLHEFLNEAPYNLSRGQRQKVAVASVLAMQPSVLIVDEPTTGLDWRESLQMMALLKQLNEDGKTVIVITHNMKVVSQFVERVVVMAGGEILADGPPHKIFLKFELLKKAHVVPPTSYLLQPVLSKFIKVNNFTIEEISAEIIKKFGGKKYANR
jgi:energy-coupling factor transport system ATP-binding protein